MKRLLRASARYAFTCVAACQHHVELVYTDQIASATACIMDSGCDSIQHTVMQTTVRRGDLAWIKVRNTMKLSTPNLLVAHP